VGRLAVLLGMTKHPSTPLSRRRDVRVVIAVLAVVTLAVLFLRQPTLSSSYVAHSHASAERLRQEVTALSATSRCDDDPDSLNRVAASIENELRATGARVSVQPFDADGNHYRNVIAAFGPDDGGELTIVGAHYDAFCLTGILPGADDNASGTAGLLELARLLGRERGLRHPIALVFYATEEPPFFASENMGSAVHAKSLGNRKAHAIVLEMIGCFTEKSGLTGLFGLLYPRRGDFIAVIGRVQDIALTRAVKRGMSASGPVVSFNGMAEGVDASDQRSYWLSGHHAVMVTDTAYLRNPRYHTASDTAGTLDYPRMARVVDGVLNALLLADAARTSGR